MGGVISNHKNQIKLDSIQIIQFCLKSYDLLRHPTYRWVDGWVMLNN